jgi:hypothetical protein
MISHRLRVSHGVATPMNRRASWLAASVVGVLAVGGLTLFDPGVAGASSDYGHAQFQVSFSLNCRDRSAACATDPHIAGSRSAARDEGEPAPNATQTRSTRYLQAQLERLSSRNGRRALSRCIASSSVLKFVLVVLPHCSGQILSKPRGVSQCK